MKLRTHRDFILWMAVTWLLLGVAAYADRHDGRGLPWHRYTWLLRLIGAVVLLVKAFWPAKHKPVEKPE